MKTAEQIVDLLKARKARMGSEQARMDEVRRIYNGELAVNLPELGSNEHAAAANLAQLGIDQMAMRVASTFPAINFYPDRLGSESAKTRARDKRDVVLNWWGHNRVHTHIIPKRARWFFGYANAPVMLRPGDDGLPRWYARDPIGLYPAPVAEVGNITPPDVIFTFKKSREELAAQYPVEMRRIQGNGQLAPMYDCLEYVDSEQITCLVMAAPPESMYTPIGGTAVEVLHTTPNRTERPLAVVPGRITLDKPLGQFDGMIGAYQTQARLMALQLIATEKAIFPEWWLVSQPGTPPAVVNVVADGREGIIGEVEGGNFVKNDMSPSPFTANVINQLEYIERASGAIPAEFSGMSSSNIRTGKRGDSVMGAAVDFRLQEAQTIFEASLVEENKIALAIARTYAGAKSFSMFVPNRGTVTYTPEKDLVGDDHEVRYAYAGADANSLTIAIGQKLGLETLSRETAMTLDPLVPDVETEKDRIISESVQRAFLSSIQSQASDPQAAWQPVDYARFGELVETNKENIYTAAMTVNEEVQARQQASQQGELEGAEAQPGLSMPGAPGAPPPAIADIGSSVGNLSQMLTQLRRPQMAIAGEGAPIGQPAA